MTTRRTARPVCAGSWRKDTHSSSIGSPGRARSRPSPLKRRVRSAGPPCVLRDPVWSLLQHRRSRCLSCNVSNPPVCFGPAKPAPVKVGLLRGLSLGRAPPGLLRIVACAQPTPPAGYSRPSSPAALPPSSAGLGRACRPACPSSPACPLVRRLSPRRLLGRCRLRLHAGRCRFTPAAGFTRGRRAVPVVARALSSGRAAQ